MATIGVRSCRLHRWNNLVDPDEQAVHQHACGWRVWCHSGSVQCAAIISPSLSVKISNNDDNCLAFIVVESMELSR